MTKQHAMTGNRNAARELENSETTLHIRCTKAEKAYWNGKAQAEKSSLSDFVRRTLPNPSAQWLKEYRERKAKPK